MKDLGPIKKCLGINVSVNQKDGTIELEQCEYIMQMLRNFGMHDWKGAVAPMDPGTTFTVTKEPVDPKIPYQNAVGALLYVFQGTRPNSAYSVSTLSRFNNGFGEIYWTAVKRVMQNLQTTKFWKLTYRRNGDAKLTGYCDASYAAD